MNMLPHDREQSPAGRCGATQKVIVIASAALSIIFATYLIIITTNSWLRIASTGELSISIFIIAATILLLIILISALVILNIRLTNPLRIILLIISITLGLISILTFVTNFYCFIKGGTDPSSFLFDYMALMAVVITLLTYIRRALRKDGLPAESQQSSDVFGAEDTVEKKGPDSMINKILLIFGVVLCAMIAIYMVVIIGQLSNLDNIKKTLETTRTELNNISTELSKLKKQNKENMLARIEMQKDRKVSKSLELLTSFNTRIIELAEQKFTNYFIDVFYLWADYGIAIEIVVVNKNKTEEQKIPVLVYLPLEIMPENVVEKGQFNIRYDIERSLYYAELTTTSTDYALVLPPGGFAKYEIIVKNVWYIPEETLQDLEIQTVDYYHSIKDSDDKLSGMPLVTAIAEMIDEIRVLQKGKGAIPVEKYIANYRHNLEQVQLIDVYLNTLKQLADQ